MTKKKKIGRKLITVARLIRNASGIKDLDTGRIMTAEEATQFLIEADKKADALLRAAREKKQDDDKRSR